jgi:ribonuclease P protein component
MSGVRIPLPPLSSTRRVTNQAQGPRDLSFPKARRLTRSAEFLRVKNEGVASRGALMIVGIFSIPAEADRPFRAGFVTSTRVGGAVVRNRVRRRLREIVRRHQHAVRPGIWMVVIARPAAARATSSQLEDEWLRLAKRVLF